MGKTRRRKAAKLLKAIERLRLRAGERLTKRIRKSQPTQNAFEGFYLD
jgi:hypothetical protein